MSGPKIRLVKRTHEGSPWDITGLVRGAYDRGTKAIASTQAKLAPLKAKKSELMKKLLDDKIRAHFKDTEFTVDYCGISGDEVWLDLSVPKTDDGFFQVQCILTLPNFKIRPHKELWHNQVRTNYGGKYKKIQLDRKSLDVPRRFTSQTPESAQQMYYKLIEALKGLRSLTPIIEEDPELQDINAELDDVYANGTTTHPLLSPGIT